MDDLISRKAVLKGICLSCTGQSDVIKVEAALVRYVKKMPSAEPEQNKPDHGYMWICPECGLEVHSDFSRCVRCGWERPTAEPERKRGRWEHIYIKRRGYTRDDRTPRARESAYCTVCRAIVPELKKISRRDSKYRTICNVFNFCPNCGADMRGGEDETD